MNSLTRGKVLTPLRAVFHFGVRLVFKTMQPSLFATFLFFEAGVKYDVSMFSSIIVHFSYFHLISHTKYGVIEIMYIIQREHCLLIYNLE